MNFSFITHSCATGITDVSDISLFSNKHHEFAKYNYQDIFDSIKSSGIASKLASLYPPPSYTLVNPGVPLIVVYFKGLATEYKLEYFLGIDQFMHSNIYPPKNILKFPGDGSIFINFVLMPAFKWAHQFETKHHLDSTKLVVTPNFSPSSSSKFAVCTIKGNKTFFSSKINFNLNVLPMNILGYPVIAFNTQIPRPVDTLECTKILMSLLFCFKIWSVKGNHH